MATIKLEAMPNSTLIATEYDVYLDSEKMNIERRQKTKEFVIEAGDHTMHVKAGSNSSKPLRFRIKEDETKAFGVGLASGARTARAIGIILGLVLIGIGLRMMSGPGIYFGVFLLAFILVIANFIYGYSLRNQYFTITELEKDESENETESENENLSSEAGIQDGPEIYIVPHFLTDGECDALIIDCESRGFREATVNIEDKEQLSYASEPYAAELWERLKWHIPPEIGDKYATGLHDLLHFYKYSPGQGFKMRQDEVIQAGTAFSYYTLIIYLNDDYEGGQIKFLSGEYIVPKKGSALFFERSLPHAGEVVTVGLKYVMCADIMYDDKSKAG